MNRLSIQRYVKDITQALPTEERDERQRELRRELSLLADAYLERGKTQAEAERAVIAHYDPTYTSLMRSTTLQEVALSLIMVAGLSLLGLVVPQMFRISNQPPSDISSNTATHTQMMQDALSAAVGTFQTAELTLPEQTASYALFLMQGDTLISATSGTFLPEQEKDALTIVFGPTYATNYRCGSESRSLYAAVLRSHMRPSVNFMCYRDVGASDNAPSEAAPYLALYDSLFTEPPRRLTSGGKADAAFGTWTPLMAYFERPYGWQGETPESFHFESVPVERWYVLYFMPLAGMVDVTTLEPPSLQSTLASEDNLLSRWSEIEKGLKSTPQP